MVGEANPQRDHHHQEQVAHEFCDLAGRHADGREGDDADRRSAKKRPQHLPGDGACGLQPAFPPPDALQHPLHDDDRIVDHHA